MRADSSGSTLPLRGLNICHGEQSQGLTAAQLVPHRLRQMCNGCSCVLVRGKVAAQHSEESSHSSDRALSHGCAGGELLPEFHVQGKRFLDLCLGFSCLSGHWAARCLHLRPFLPWISRLVSVEFVLLCLGWIVEHHTCRLCSSTMDRAEVQFKTRIGEGTD